MFCPVGTIDCTGNGECSRVSLGPSAVGEGFRGENGFREVSLAMIAFIHSLFSLSSFYCCIRSSLLLLFNGFMIFTVLKVTFSLQMLITLIYLFFRERHH